LAVTVQVPLVSPVIEQVNDNDVGVPEQFLVVEPLLATIWTDPPVSETDTVMPIVVFLV